MDCLLPTSMILEMETSPHGSLLHCTATNERPQAAILTQQQWTKLTYSIMVPTNQPFDGPPVTPYDNHQWIVHLPVPPLLVPVQSAMINLCYCTLTAQFRNTLAEWQWPLFGPIHRLQPTVSLLQVSQVQGMISLISNASVQKSKQSGFAWTLAHENQMLWRGVGLAPGHKEDIYLGRAKAFGLLVGLTFLNHYMDSYNHGHFQETQLHCFCDNLGVITNVTALLMPSTLCTNNTTNNDHDVYLAISTLALSCSPLQPSFLQFRIWGNQAITSSLMRSVCS